MPRASASSSPPPGKIKRGQSMKRHILTKKAQGRKRSLRKSVLVSDADHANVKRMLLG